MSKGQQDIEGQMSLFDFIPEPDPQPKWHLPCDTCRHDVKGCCDIDYHSGSYCVLGDKWEKKELTPAEEYYLDTGKTTYWQDSQGKPAEWWKNEQVYPLDIRGLMDDPYCPKCGRGFWDYGPKSEVDCERCPDCGIRIDWTLWHRLNDKYHGGENNGLD